MTRPDLKSEYSGWQAFDGTPELPDSAGIFRAGPAPLLAIRRGEIDVVYNSKTFVGAANCDEYFYRVDKKNRTKMELLGINTRSVGAAIVTMNPSGKRDDITSTYKPREGTPEERKVYNFARSKLGGENSRFLVGPTKPKEKEDVCFKVRQIPEIMIGKTFKLYVDVVNNSRQKRTVHFTAAIASVFYNGVMAKKVKSDSGNLDLQPSQKRALLFTVGPDIYLDKLVEYLTLRVYAEAHIFETNQTWATSDIFQFSRPPLQIEYYDKTIRPKLNQPLKVSFSFTNPLNVTLKKCAIIMEGLGLIEFSKSKLGDLGPMEALTHVETITPQKVGSHKLIAVLTTHLMVAVLGSKQLDVEEA